MSQEELEALNELVLQPAWPLFLTVLGSMYGESGVNNIETVEQLYEAKGNLEVMNFISQFETYIEQAME